MKSALLISSTVALFATAVHFEVVASDQDKMKLRDDRDPVLHYTFDIRHEEAIPNEMGEAHPGRIHGASFVEHLSGGSALIVRKDNSPTGYVEAAHHADFNSPTFTVAAWIKIRREESSGSVVCNHDWAEGPGRGFVLRCYQGKPINFTLGTNRWFSTDGTTPVPMNEWVHVAGTFDGTHLRVFFNGTLEGTNEVEGDYRPSPYPLRIGHGAFALEQPRKFDGQIDDVMFWNRDLAEDELRAIYETQIDSRPAPLTVEDIAPLVEQLGARVYLDRVAAETRLIELDTEILPLLKSYRDHDDAEIAYRIKQIETAILPDQNN